MYNQFEIHEYSRFLKAKKLIEDRLVVTCYYDSGATPGNNPNLCSH